jgi:RNA polymerase sigma-B factor
MGEIALQLRNERTSLVVMAAVELREAVGVAPRSPDPGARTRVIESYLPLVSTIARRFAGRGEPLEDLVQVGTVALVKAVDRCDPERASRLTSYAATCVEGEIRRHLRDRCAPLRVPRSLHGDAGLMASLRAPAPLEGEAELLPVPDTPDDVGVSRALVAAAARTLDGRERRVVALRYFLDLSQAEIGDAVGLSQAHVSRLLEGALGKMRTALAAEERARPLAKSVSGATL